MSNPSSLELSGVKAPPDAPIGEAAARALATVQPQALAAMLFGSYARGTATPASDIDVLAVVPHGPRSYSVGRVNVTAYLPIHLERLAQHGSLFILHLLREGVVLTDEHSILRDRLSKYTTPPSYNPLRNEILLAAQALDASVEEINAYGPQLHRLGLFLLRTSLYAAAQEASLTTFDIDFIAQRMATPAVQEALRQRHNGDYSRTNLSRLKTITEQFLRGPNVSRTITLEQLALRLSERHSYASGLITYVLSAQDELDYTILPLPPI